MANRFTEAEVNYLLYLILRERDSVNEISEKYNVELATEKGVLATIIEKMEI